jgi:hypothetical protein
MGPKKPRRYRENREDKAIMALLEHATTERAAAAIGVSPVTMWRLLRREDFQSLLRMARHRAYSQCVGRLQQASSAAVGVLLRLMTDPASPAASRVRAADCVLSHAADAIELDGFEERLSNLEQAAEKLKEESEGEGSYRGELPE